MPLLISQKFKGGRMFIPPTTLTDRPSCGRNGVFARSVLKCSVVSCNLCSVVVVLVVDSIVSVV